MEESLDEVEKMFTENIALYKDLLKDFASDIEIVCSGVILPGHKYVLSSRCEVLSNILRGVDQLDWNAYESSIGIALLRWFYTDVIVSADDTVTLGLLRASHNFGLTGLFETCEKKLLLSNNENSSPDFYTIAKEVNATMLIEKYLKFKTTLVDDLNSKSLIEIDNGIRINSLTSYNFNLGCLDKASREVVIALLKRKDKLDKSCLKLKQSLIGVRQFVNFFDTTIWGWPAHKFVLLGRSEMLEENALHWSGISKQNERVLMRWLYTDTICFTRTEDALALLQVSHKYELHALFEICEQTVIKTLSPTSCAHVHMIATNLEATNMLEHAERTLHAYWDGIKSELFKDVADVSNADEWKGMVCEQPSPLEKTEAPTLLTLNDDCLLHLFRFISLVDLGSIKGTCKRLHHLADQSFKLYRDKSLAIGRYSMVADIWNLKQFGKLLESLSLDGVYEEYCSRTDILRIISRFSNEQLNTISLSLDYEKSVTAENLLCLKNVLKNVKKIQLNDCDGKLVELLLSFCENLSEIHIDCEELELNTLWCSKNSNIKSVTLRALRNDNVLEEICDNLVHLESLTMNIPDKNGKLNYLAKLNNLKNLKIDFYDAEVLSDVVSPMLQLLASKNMLENLSIQASLLTDTTAFAICNFSKLQELEFEYTDFNATALNILSDKLNVDKLTFRDCEDITFEDITKMVVNKLNMNVLTVSGCDSIEVIERQHYLRLTKKRSLQIYLDIDVFEKTVKLLANDLSDYVKIAAIETN